MKQRPIIQRAFPLIDLEVTRGDGDSRLVTAYAATFDDPYPVVDQWGDYDEEIDPRAFNRALSHGIHRTAVLFNHGMTVWGTPSEEFSKPLGSPVEIRPEKRGLLTVTRYNRTPLADEVLEMIANGDVRAQSFRGAVFRSAPPSTRDGRKVIRRLELGLKEYGPAPFVANPGAEIVAMRSALADRLGGKFTAAQIADILEALGDDPVDLDALAADLGTGTTPPADPQDTQAAQPAVEAPADPGSSVELDADELFTRRARHNQP